MRKIVWFGSSLVIAVAAITSLTAVRSSQAQAQAALGNVARWEYTLIRGLSVEAFNELGDKGWELCVAGSNNSPNTDYVFKRPRR